MQKIEKTILYAGGAMLAVLCFMVVCLNDVIDYFWKMEQSVSNIVLLPIGLLIFAAVAWIGKMIAKRALKRGRGEKNIFVGVIISAIIFFVLLVYLTHQYYFRTGWDVDVLFIGSMKLMSGGDLTALNNYLAMYPNNALLVLLQSFILKVNVILGIFPEMDGLFSLVEFQCGIVALSGVVFYDVMKKISGSVETAMMGYAVYQLFFLTSPWTAIPYSDTVGLIVPLLVIDLAITNKGGWFKYLLRFAAIGALTYLGFQIKPQLAIMSIAVVLVMFATSIGKGIFGQWLKKLPALAVMAAMFVGMSVIVSAVSEQILPTKQYEDQNMIPTHYLMMGLNTERDGAYVYEDVEISVAQPNKEARKEENLRVIRERLENMGVGGLSSHLVKKLMSCYADGTFFWGREGNFYNIVPSEKNEHISPFLRNVFHNVGTHYESFKLFRQAIWCAALLFSALAAWNLKKSRADTNALAMVYLAIIGLTVFELLFEARSRYLYSYVPIYLLAAVQGCSLIINRRKAKR